MSDIPSTGNPMQPSDSLQYWLLVNNVPQGPFSALDLHAKLKTGEINWDSMICQVGQPNWQAMRFTPSLVPQAQHSEPSSPTPVAPNTRPLWSGYPQLQKYLKNPELKKYVLFGLAIALVAGVIWYFIPASQSPVEPCYRYFAAKDIVELRSISTPNLHPIFNAMFQGPVHNLGQNLRFIDQSPAPAKFMGHFVGFYFEDVDDNQRTVAIEGVFHLLDQGSWKIEDIYLTSMNNRVLDKPMSMAHDYWPLIGKEVPSHSKMKQTIFSGNEILKWQSDPRYREELRKSQSSAARATGRGWAAVVIFVVGFLATVFLKKRKQAPT
ncbi:MAG: DUF4339 domain-containing protein [Gemmatales bacterium]